jgi:hypothetical protein
LWIVAFGVVAVARAQSVPGSPVVMSSSGENSAAPTGSGAATQVTFWSGTSTLSGDDALWWDNTNKRLGVETKTPAVDLDVTKARTTPTKVQIQNTTSAANASAEYDVVSDVAQGHFGAYSTAYTHVPSMALAFGMLAETGTHTPMRFDTPDTDEPIQFVQGTQRRFDMTSGGNLIVPQNQGAIITGGAVPISAVNSAMDFVNAMGSSLGSGAYTIAVRTTSNTGNAAVEFFHNSTTWDGTIRSDSSGQLAAVSVGGNYYIFTGGDFGTGHYLGLATSATKTTATFDGDAADTVARSATGYNGSTPVSSTGYSTLTSVTLNSGVAYSCQIAGAFRETVAADGVKVRINPGATAITTAMGSMELYDQDSALGGGALHDTGSVVDASVGSGTILELVDANVTAGHFNARYNITPNAAFALALQGAQQAHTTGTVTFTSTAIDCVRL